MVRVAERKIGDETYYYLEHSYRKGEAIVKSEKYLGKALPKNISQLRNDFVYQLNAEKWFGQFDLIRNKYSEQIKDLPKAALEKEVEGFAIKFTYDTNRIEGSTITLKETAELLQNGTTPQNKPLRDVKETEAHAKLFYEMLNYEKDLSLQTLLYFHTKLLQDTEPDIAGKIRGHQVAIAASKFLPPSPVEVEPLLSEFFKWYARSKQKTHAVELAALVHLKLVTIHPFTDGNGRISRLLMNFVLNRMGFPLLNITYKNRSSYYNALERAQTKGNQSIFLNWFFRRYLKENKKYLPNSK